MVDNSGVKPLLFKCQNFIWTFKLLSFNLIFLEKLSKELAAVFLTSTDIYLLFNRNDESMPLL